jgi:hypothetical protein
MGASFRLMPTVAVLATVQHKTATVPTQNGNPLTRSALPILTRTHLPEWAGVRVFATKALKKPGTW